MSESAPMWRQGYDTVERRLGPSLAAAARSEQFAIGVGLAAQLQRAVQKRTARSTRRLLHSLNLPAGTDVSRLLAEIGELKKQVRHLSQQLERATANRPGADSPPPRLGPARSASTGKAVSARTSTSSASAGRKPRQAVSASARTSPAASTTGRRTSATSATTANRTKRSGAART